MLRLGGCSQIWLDPHLTDVYKGFKNNKDLFLFLEIQNLWIPNPNNH